MCAWSTLYTFIAMFLWFFTFRTVSMSIFGFLYWTRTADRGLILFGKVFALVISEKLLCRWGWLFRWLWKWKEGEGRVLYTRTFLCTHQKNCPLKLAQIYHRYTYTAVTLPAKCQCILCATNGLSPDEGQGVGPHVGCPVSFQNCCEAGAGLILSWQRSCKTPNSFCCHYGLGSQRAKWFAEILYLDI